MCSVPLYREEQSKQRSAEFARSEKNGKKKFRLKMVNGFAAKRWKPVKPSIDNGHETKNERKKGSVFFLPSLRCSAEFAGLTNAGERIVRKRDIFIVV